MTKAPLSTLRVDEEPIISVIIPALNAANTLPATIQSVVDQSFPRWELIVVDDGSSDDTAGVARSYVVPGGSRVKVISTENCGVSAARNLGIDLASGKFVAFLDSDDLWSPFKLEKQLQAIDNNPSAIGCACFYSSFWEYPTQLVQDFRPEWDPKSILDWMLLEGKGVLLPSTFLGLRSLIRSLGGFDTRLGSTADLDLAHRIVASGSVVTVPETLTYYRLSERQMHRDVELLRRDYAILFEKMPQLGSTHLRTRVHVNLRLLEALRLWQKRQSVSAFVILIRILLTHPIFTLRRCLIGLKGQQ